MVVEEEEHLSTLKISIGLVCFIYFILIWSVSLLGLSQARRKYGKPRDRRRFSILPSPLSSATDDFAAAAAAPTSSSASSTTAAPSEGVSILRPLAGLDHNLLANLSSSFEQDFPKDLYEVILSVRNEEDQALSVAREVCSRYPHTNSRIIVGDEPSSGVNPKIANLVRSYAAAKFDIIWVLDSQVQHGRSALRRAVQAMTSAQQQAIPIVPSLALSRQPHGSRVGLAHHCPLAVTPHSTSLGSHIEAIFLGTNHAKMYLAINSLLVDSCVMGKSNFYRKSDLARVPDEFFNVGAEGTRGEQGAIGSIAFQQTSSVTMQSTPSSSPSSTAAAAAKVTSSSSSSPPYASSSSSSNPHLMDRQMDTTAAIHRSPSHHGESQQRQEELLTSKTISRPLARFGIFLAEDNMLALSLWRPPLSLGHVLLDADVARMTVGDVKSVRDYIKRRIRWIRVRRYMVPAATYLEPFTESILCTIIITWAFSRIWVPYLFFASSSTNNNRSLHFIPSMIFFLLHLFLWHHIDFAVLASLQEAGRDSRGSLPSLVIDFNDQAQVRYYRFAWLCREILAFPIWLTALCGSTVTWRDKQYRILSDARAARVVTGCRSGSDHSSASTYISTSASRTTSSSRLLNMVRSPLTSLSNNQGNRKRYDRLPTEPDP